MFFLELAIRGHKQVIIEKAGKQLVQLVSFQPVEKPRKPGRLKGKIKLAPDFDHTLEGVIHSFEQEASRHLEKPASSVK